MIRVAIDLIGSGLVKDVVQGDAASTEGAAPAQVVIEVPAERKRTGLAVRLVIGEPGQDQIDLRQRLQVKKPDPTLVALLAKAADWYERLTRDGRTPSEIAQQDQVTSTYVSRVVQLALLAPDIAQGIERGEQPMELTANRLVRLVPLPMQWEAQRELLGMA